MGKVYYLCKQTNQIEWNKPAAIYGSMQAKKTENRFDGKKTNYLIFQTQKIKILIIHLGN
jgi:hypothetical protein